MPCCITPIFGADPGAEPSDDFVVCGYSIPPRNVTDDDDSYRTELMLMRSWGRSCMDDHQQQHFHRSRMRGSAPGEFPYQVPGFTRRAAARRAARHHARVSYGRRRPTPPGNGRRRALIGRSPSAPPFLRCYKHIAGHGLIPILLRPYAALSNPVARSQRPNSSKVDYRPAARAHALAAPRTPFLPVFVEYFQVRASPRRRSILLTQELAPASPAAVILFSF